MDKEIKISDHAPKNIIFQIKGKEILVMNENGIKCNRENFPDWQPDDFVNAFLNILENKCHVEFVRKPDG